MRTFTLVLLGLRLFTLSILLPEVPSVRAQADFPTRLTVENMEWVDALVADQKNLIWSPLFDRLADLPDRPIVRYARAVANMQRRAVSLSEQAVGDLSRLYQDTLAAQGQKITRLSSRLLFALGRGKIHLGHHQHGLEIVAQSLEELRHLFDDKDLARLLVRLCQDLIHFSINPADALEKINELSLLARQSGLTRADEQARGLLRTLQRVLQYENDYFDHARARLHLFGGLLGVVEQAQFESVDDGEFLIRGQIADQQGATQPAWMRYNGLFFRRDRSHGGWVQPQNQGALESDQILSSQVAPVTDGRMHVMARDTRAALQTADGAWWFATPKGLYREFASFIAPLGRHQVPELPVVVDLIQWPDNNVWSLGSQGELARIGPPHYRHFGVRDGLVQPKLVDLVELGDYLYGLNDDGLIRIDPSRDRIDYVVSGVEGFIPQMSQPRRLIRLSTQKLALAAFARSNSTGLWLFDGQKGEPGDKHNRLDTKNAIGWCEFQPGVIKLARADEVKQFDTLTHQVRHAGMFDSLATKGIRQIICSPWQVGFVLTGNAEIWRFDDDSLTLVAPEQIGLLSKPKRLINSDKVGLFIVGERNLARFDPVKNVWSSLTPPQLGKVQVQDVIQDARSRLYVATDRGIWVNEGEIWVRLSTADGLPCDDVRQVLSYQDDLWIACETGGLGKWTWPEQAAPESMIIASGWAYYRDQHGRHHRLRLSDGIEKENWVQLASPAGLFEIEPNRLDEIWSPEKSIAPQATQVATVDSPIECDKNVYESDQLQFGVRGIVPHLSDRSEDLFYHYRLDGGPWELVRSKTTLTLSGVKDGRHTLQVRATDRRFQKDLTDASYCFQVSHPQSVLAWIVPGMLVFLGLIAGYKRRWFVWSWARRGRVVPLDPSAFRSVKSIDNQTLPARQSQIKSLHRLFCSDGGVAVVWGLPGMGKQTLLRTFAKEVRQQDSLVIELDVAALERGCEVTDLIRAMTLGLAEVLYENHKRFTRLEGFWDDQLPSLDSTASAESEFDYEEINTSGSIERLIFGEKQGDLKLSCNESEVARSLFENQKNQLVQTKNDQKNPFSILERALRRLQRFFPSLKIVYLLSNAHQLNLAGSYFFQFLKNQAQQRSNLIVVFELEGRYQTLCKRFESLFAFARPIGLQNLPARACYSFVARSFSDKAWIGHNALTKLCALSGGQPYLTQVLVESLVHAMNRHNSNRCDSQLIDQELDAVLCDQDFFFDAIWRGLNRVERLLAAALSDKKNQSDLWWSVPQVLRILEQNGIILLAQEITLAIATLAQDGLLQRKQKTFQIQWRLLQRWIQHHHTLESVQQASVDTIAHYQLLDQLEKRELDIVYKARDMVQGELVSIKLLSSGSASKRIRRRFMRDARLGKRNRHPNLIHIKDYGHQSDTLYCVMEYVEGFTLKEWMRKRESVSQRLAIKIGAYLASALRSIHDMGLLHRALSSDHIMLVDESRVDAGRSSKSTQDDLAGLVVKLMDFDLSLAQKVSQDRLLYRSPEQVRGEQIDFRSDLYSLGVVLYELLCGQLPFEPNDANVLNGMGDQPPMALALARPEIHPELDALVQSLLSHNPMERPASSFDVFERLVSLSSYLERKPLCGLTG